MPEISISGIGQGLPDSINNTDPGLPITARLDNDSPWQDETYKPHQHRPDCNGGTAGIEVVGSAVGPRPGAVLAQDDSIGCDKGQEYGVLELRIGGQAQQPGVSANDGCQCHRPALKIITITTMMTVIMRAIVAMKVTAKKLGVSITTASQEQIANLTVHIKCSITMHSTTALLRQHVCPPCR